MKCSKDIERLGFSPQTLKDKHIIYTKKGYTCGYRLKVPVHQEGIIKSSTYITLHKILGKEKKLLMKVPSIINDNTLISLISNEIGTYLI